MACTTVRPPPVEGPPPIAAHAAPEGPAPSTAAVPFSPRAVLALLPTAPPPAPWHAGPTQDYAEHGSGLGVSLRYEAPFGHVDLYVYDADQADLRPGLDDLRAREQFTTALQEIDLARQRGLYDSAQVLQATQDSLQGDPWLHATVALVRQGDAVESHLYLRVEHHHFVKVRASLPAPATDAARAGVLDLVVERHRSLLRLFGPTPGPSTPRSPTRL